MSEKSLRTKNQTTFLGDQEDNRPDQELLLALLLVNYYFIPYKLPPYLGTFIVILILIINSWKEIFKFCVNFCCINLRIVIRRNLYIELLVIGEQQPDTYNILIKIVLSCPWKGGANLLVIKIRDWV